jgi:hypothetical protein
MSVLAHSALMVRMVFLKEKGVNMEPALDNFEVVVEVHDIF